MAILQESNAVFYHPLDDLTEALQAQAWAGPNADRFGRVAGSKGQADASFTTDLPGGIDLTPLSGVGTTYVEVARLTATTAVVLWGNPTGSVAGKIATLTGTDITFGPSSSSTLSAQPSGISAAGLSSTKFVAMHGQQSVVGNVSGTDITWGTPGTIPSSTAASTDSYFPRVAVFSASVIAVAYQVSGQTVVRGGVIGATTVTWGGGGGVGARFVHGAVDIVALDATKFIVAWHDDITQGLKLSYGQMIGSTPSIFGGAGDADIPDSDTTVGTGHGNAWLKMARVDDRTAALVYFPASTPDFPLVRVLTVDPTTITVGLPNRLTDPVYTATPTAVFENAKSVSVAWDAPTLLVSLHAQFNTPGVAAVKTHMMELEGDMFVERGVGDANPSHNVAAGGPPQKTQTATVVMSPGLALVAHAAGTSSSGKLFPLSISRPSLAATATTFGAEHEFLGEPTHQNRITFLDATRFVVAYSDNNDLNRGMAKVGTVSGTDITFGAESLFSNVGAGVISVATLSATTVVVAYKDLSNLDRGKAKVGTVAGTFIAFGAETMFSDTGGEFAAGNVAALSSTTFVVAYNDPIAGKNAAKVGTVLGTDITFGAETVFYAPGAQHLYATVLSATVFVVAYQIAATSGAAKVGTVSGTDITFGGEMTFNAAQTIWISAAAISAAQFVVAYQDGGDSFHGTAKVGTVSGTTITFGAESEFLAASAEQMSVAAIGPAKVVVAYVNNPAGSHGTVSVGTVSGTDIAFGAEAEFLSVPGASDLEVATDAAGRYVVVYTDQDDGNHGTAKVGSSYPSAVGATRLAFASWTRRGRELSAPGAPATVEATTTSAQLAISALDSTRLVVAYRNDITDCRARVLTLSGTDLTVGPAHAFHTGNISDVALAVMDANTIVVAYSDEPTETKSRVGAVSGLDITFGAVSTVQTEDNIPDDFQLEPLGASTVILKYQGTDSSPSTSSSVTVQIGTVAGMDVTWGPQQHAATGGISTFGNLWMAVLSPTSIVVVYRDNGATQLILRAGTVSGTDVTWGPLFTGTTDGDIDGGEQPHLAPIDSDRFMLSFTPNTGSSLFSQGQWHAWATVGTVAAGVVTLGPKSRIARFRSSRNDLTTIDARRMLAVGTWVPGVGSDPKGQLARVGHMSGTGIVFDGSPVGLALGVGVGSNSQRSTIAGNTVVSVYHNGSGEPILAVAAAIAP